MKTVMLSFAVAALTLVSSVASAQCSSCGQSAAQPLTFSQPVVSQPIISQPIVSQPVYNEVISQPTIGQVSYAQPTTSGCSSCGTANYTSFATPTVASYAPVQTAYAAPQTSACCGTPAPAPSACCCSTGSSRGGLFRGRSGGSNQLIRSGARSGLFGAIRDN